MLMAFPEEESEIAVVDEDLHDAKCVAFKGQFDEDFEEPAVVIVAEDGWKSSCRATGDFLLCLLLLTGIISVTLLTAGLFRVTRHNSQREMKMVQLQTSYNNLIGETYQLVNNNLTERDQLQTSYNDLTKERDQLQTSNNYLTKERDQFLARCNNLTKERDQLQTSHNDLTIERDQFLAKCNNLTKERDQLQTSYDDLTIERDQFLARWHNLTNERDQLETSYSNLTKEKKKLQKRIEALTKVKNDLQREFQDIEASYKNLTEERAELRKSLKDFEWLYFKGSFYYISTVKKNWQESRDDCLHAGADLMIINSKEEQNFTRQFKKLMWIGLTDEETEGTWRWVDGTPLDKSYWGSREPNGEEAENCGHIKFHDSENSWNDETCSLTHFSICEKKFLP